MSIGHLIKKYPRIGFERYKVHYSPSAEKFNSIKPPKHYDGRIILYVIAGEDLQKDAWISPVEIHWAERIFKKKFHDDKVFSMSTIKKSINYLEKVGILTVIDTKYQLLKSFDFDGRPFPV